MERRDILKIEIQDWNHYLREGTVYLLRIYDRGSNFWGSKSIPITEQLCGLGPVTKVLYAWVSAFVKCVWQE